MKYNVGDKVRIKSLDWYNENKDKDGFVDFSTSVFVPGMSQFCGKIVTIEDVFEEEDGVVYCMKRIDCDWTDEMFEGLVEEEMPLDKAGQITDFEYDGLAYTLPDGYQFVDENGNVINATKIVLEKKKKEYPKTYEECCKILEIRSLGNGTDGYKWEILSTFQNLIICRDAYWKIAGEEMGLGKPWEPDWKNRDEKKWVISRYRGELDFGFNIEPFRIFAFPTPEMRDAFYKNFKELIELCKELL